MDIKGMILAGAKIHWNHAHDVQFVDENDVFALQHYHFMEEEISKILMVSKKSKYCGVEMTRSNLIFNYHTFSLQNLEDMYYNGTISFVF